MPRMPRQALRDYEWCSDQMKAIRQDLTLQNIKDAFAAEVYESHARLALENRDYSNYKQCQVRNLLFWCFGPTVTLTLARVCIGVTRFGPYH
jgi:hypothetical protein|eukprot:COSAG06_NODE_2136_length_7521_cov_5.249461_1_plen_92_part_00